MSRNQLTQSRNYRLESILCSGLINTTASNKAGMSLKTLLVTISGFTNTLSCSDQNAAKHCWHIRELTRLEVKSSGTWWLNVPGANWKQSSAIAAVQMNIKNNNLWVFHSSRLRTPPVDWQVDAASISPEKSWNYQPMGLLINAGRRSSVFKNNQQSPHTQRWNGFWNPI